MPELTTQGAPTNQKVVLGKRLTRLADRVERIKFRLNRKGETDVTLKSLTEELKMTEAEMTYKDMKFKAL